jgi:predicted DNA-binding transcriptional regulator AlpA
MVRKKQDTERSRRGGRVVKTKAGIAPLVPEPTSEMLLVPAPKLRRMIGVSAVTLWRWRQDEGAGFPPVTTINGRNYFAWPAVQAWLVARQQQAA